MIFKIILKKPRWVNEDQGVTVFGEIGSLRAAEESRARLAFSLAFARMPRAEPGGASLKTGKGFNQPAETLDILVGQGGLEPPAN